MKPIDELIGATLKTDIPDFNVGDSVNVEVAILEGGKEKLQVFKGVVIVRRGTGMNETFVVRKVSYGEGVERTFYLHSPRVKKIAVFRKGKARRARLYYLRNKIGKSARVKELKEEAQKAVHSHSNNGSPKRSLGEVSAKAAVPKDVDQA